MPWDCLCVLQYAPAVPDCVPYDDTVLSTSWGARWHLSVTRGDSVVVFVSPVVLDADAMSGGIPLLYLS